MNYDVVKQIARLDLLKIFNELSTLVNELKNTAEHSGYTS